MVPLKFSSSPRNYRGIIFARSKERSVSISFHWQQFVRGHARSFPVTRVRKITPFSNASLVFEVACDATEDGAVDRGKNKFPTTMIKPCPGVTNSERMNSNGRHVPVALICRLRNRFYGNDNKRVALMKHPPAAKMRDLKYR